MTSGHRRRRPGRSFRRLLSGGALAAPGAGDRQGEGAAQPHLPDQGQGLQPLPALQYPLRHRRRRPVLRRQAQLHPQTRQDRPDPVSARIGRLCTDRRDGADLQPLRHGRANLPHQPGAGPPDQAGSTEAGHRPADHQAKTPGQQQPAGPYRLDGRLYRVARGGLPPSGRGLRYHSRPRPGHRTGYQPGHLPGPAHHHGAGPGRRRMDRHAGQGQTGSMPSQRGIEVGVRVEVHNEIMQDLCSIIYDPTFFIRTSRYDDQTRTFCTNFGRLCRAGKTISTSFASTATPIPTGKATTAISLFCQKSC